MVEALREGDATLLLDLTMSLPGERAYTRLVDQPRFDGETVQKEFAWPLLQVLALLPPGEDSDQNQKVWVHWRVLLPVPPAPEPKVSPPAYSASSVCQQPRLRPAGLREGLAQSRSELPVRTEIAILFLLDAR